MDNFGNHDKKNILMKIKESQTKEKIMVKIFNLIMPKWDENIRKTKWWDL